MKKIILVLVTFLIFTHFCYAGVTSSQKQIFTQKIDSVFLNLENTLSKVSKERQLSSLNTLTSKITLLKKKYASENAQFILTYLQYKTERKIAFFRLVLDPQKYSEYLWVGMDVDWAKTSDGMELYDEKIVADFKKVGISHVRIRVKDDMSEALLQHLQKIVDDCMKYWIIPVIAYQWDFFKKAPTEKNANRVAEWWWSTAKYFESYSWILAFDLIIEPTDALNKSSDPLNIVYEKSVSTIRKYSPERIIFIAPRVRSAPENLSELKIPTQANGYVMAEWHFYASWPSKTNDKKLWTTGSESEKDLIREKIKTVKSWWEKNSIFTWVGAWMPGNYNEGDDYSIEEQKAFAHFVTCELKKNNISHAFNSDIKFYDRETKKWISEMMPVMEEIIHPNCL
jgi:Cellulase (glycosyl hydrolase family 5)